MRTRPPTAADHDALVHLVNRGALGGEGDVEDKPRDALITELTAPTLDADRDLRLWLDDAGAIAAFARLRREPVDGGTDGRLLYTIRDGDAAARALEREVVTWAARRLCEAAAPRRRLIHAVSVRDPARADRLAGLGFAPLRRRHTMVRDLTGALPDAPPPDGIRIRPCRGAADAEAYVAVFNAAFADSLDFSPLTVAEFLHDVAAPDYRPHRDAVAEARDGTLAGHCFVVVDASQPRRGYVASLGVAPGHRRTGLGAALLAAALHRLRADGVTEAYLNVDVDSPTGAPRLYQRLGFTVGFVETRLALDEPGVVALAA
ncbi:MAG: GNAT family N-acetyltransferase [Kofleriaceae bacterium]|nr:GNAT family N-acetyltransferase [Kofleriaceae bacterium]